MKAVIARTIVVVSTLGVLAAPAGAVPMLHLDVGGAGPDGSAPLGGTVAVQVLASDIPAGSDGDGLFGVGFALEFDPAALEVTSYGPGPLFDGTGGLDLLELPGRVGFIANRLSEPDGPSGDDILAGSLVLKALLPGLHDVALAGILAPGDNVLFDGTQLDTDPGFFGVGSVSVPGPGGATLVLSGLLAGPLRRVLRRPARSLG